MPDISILHQRPTGKKSKTIISNGNKLPPVKMFGNKITFLNTCAFDSILEILCSAYCNIKQFREFVDKCTKPDHTIINIFNAVSIYANKGICRSVYQHRANLLYLLVNENSNQNNIISCTQNIVALFEKLMNDHASLIEEILCSKCNYKKLIQKPTISVSAKAILLTGIQCLEFSIHKVLENRATSCCICDVNSNNKTARSTQICGPYLCIDMEYIYDDCLQEAYIGKNIKTNIKDIPVNITIKGARYILCGVVQYIKPITTDGLGHYIAFCRSVTNNWEKRDDCHNKTEYLQGKFPDIRIAIILYARCDLYLH